MPLFGKVIPRLDPEECNEIRTIAYKWLSYKCRSFAYEKDQQPLRSNVPESKSLAKVGLSVLPESE